MASSVPALCIDDESFKGTVIDNLNGKIFKNNTEYENDVLELYKSKDIKKYKEQARIQAEHCSSSAYAERVLEVYKRAIKEKEEKQNRNIIRKIVNKVKDKKNANSFK